MKLLFLGDVMLGRLVNEVLKAEPPEYVWGDTMPVLRGVDLRICNLECVISDAGTPWSATPKVFHFRTDAKNVQVLKVAGIDLVSLANNHSLDFQDEALLQMLEVLDDAGIHRAGAGRNLDEASSPAVCEINGKKVGVIAFTDNEPEWEATDSRPGVFYVPIRLPDKRAQRLLGTIKATRDTVDTLIVSAHWGPNWGYTPPPEHLSFGHALMDAGADMLFGHSGHIVRGIEVYQGKPILYCAGNFVDDYAVDPDERNDQSFIFIVETENEVTRRIILYPTVIRSFQARMAEAREARGIALKLKELCGLLQTPATWRAEERYLEIAL